MDEILFTKMHGAGNDYIYVNCLETTPREPEQLARQMSDRHFGAGADGLILIQSSEVADFKMRMFNADGSEGRMCGNASRCIGKYVHDYQLTDRTIITLETLSGIKTLTLTLDDRGEVASVTVDMGHPTFCCADIPVRHTKTEMIRQAVDTSIGPLEITAVSMGNPHGVIFTDTTPSLIPLDSIGPELEHHTMWPDRANIEFARIISPHKIEMRVWERGSGETMACGTGACAVAAAAVRLGLAEWPVETSLPGGTLNIDCTPDGDALLLTGPAVTVMEGRYYRTL